MNILTISVLMLALSVSGGPAGESPANPEPFTLFDFNADSESRWQVVNDGVMGGRSLGFVAIDEGILHFTGTLVTRGGGFTSIRTDRTIDLEGFDGLELRVRGGGRTFEVEVDDGTRFRNRRIVSRRAAFDTHSEWTLVRIPFSAFQASVFGRRVEAPAIDLAKVKRFGFYMVDGKDGPFRLEVDTIGVYRAEAL